jgi:hypothetical protein
MDIALVAPTKERVHMHSVMEVLQHGGADDEVSLAMKMEVLMVAVRYRS